MQGSIWQCLWVLIPALWLASWYWPWDQNKSRKCLSAHGKQNDSNGWKTEPLTLMFWVPSLDNDGDRCKSLSMILITSMMWVHFFFCYKLTHRVASCLLVEIEFLWWRSGPLQCRGEQRQPASCDTIAWRLGDPLANRRWFMRLRQWLSGLNSLISRESNCITSTSHTLEVSKCLLENAVRQ